VVVEVVAEGLDMRDNLIAPLLGEMAREEHYRGQLGVEQVLLGCLPNVM
jgi:hypothetical protein